MKELFAIIKNQPIKLQMVVFFPVKYGAPLGVSGIQSNFAETLHGDIRNTEQAIACAIIIVFFNWLFINVMNIKHFIELVYLSHFQCTVWHVHYCVYTDKYGSASDTLKVYYALINRECGPYAKIFVVTSCRTDRTK